MTLDLLRERIFRAKQQELTQTVLSRKRKLRELYAVASAPGPIPDRADVDHDDVTLISADETAFLDANDILKGRSFDESTLPAPRSYVSQTESTSHEDTNPPAWVSVPSPMVPSSWQDVEVLAPPKTVTVTEAEYRPPASLAHAMTHDDDDDNVVRLGRGRVEETPSRQTPLVSATPRPDGPPSPPSTQSPPDETAIDKQVDDASSTEVLAGTVTDALHTVSPPKTLQPLTELASCEQEDTDPMPDPIASTVAHPASRSTRRDGDGRRRKRLKISNVILEKRRSRTSTPSRASHRRESKPRADLDYMLPLCVTQAYTPPRAPTLNSLVMTAHKAVSTQDQALDRREQQVARILKRVWQLQHANTWSLRQTPRAVEPSRPPTHWDALMDHVQDMRTDFRQDRAWRTTAARNLARWCADWVQRAPSDRRALQIRVRPPGRATIAEEDGHRSGPVMCLDVDEPLPTLKEEDRSWPPTPSRRPSAEAPMRHPGHTAASATLFTLDSDQVSFAVQKSLFGDPLLNKLPLHRAVDGVPLESVSDASWRLPIVPISKFMTAKIALPPLARSPKRKRDAGDVGDGPVKCATGRSFHSPEPVESPLTSANGDPNVVLLFDPEYQLMRGRIHAGHAFRPPAEDPMPLQSFFESRHPSQWTAAEEDQLRDLVEEYAYNWSLISSMLSSKSMFSSGAERRTPWECFERWVGLEGLPPEMQRTPYFRAYQARKEAAQRKTMPQPSPSDGSNATMITATTPTVVVAPARNRPTEPMRIERRKRTRHLSLIDAMKKLAKQRETSLQKQQHAASMAAMRKANVDPAHPRIPVQTPQEFSRIKYERDVKYQERAEAYCQQVYAQQRAAFHQQRSAQQPAAPPVPTTSAVPPARNGHIPPPSTRSPHAPAAPSNGPVLGVFPGQPGSHPSVPQPPANNLPTYGNGIGNAHAPHAYKPMAVKGVPQAHMQPGLPGHQRPSQPMTNDMRVLMENNRIQQEQRRLLQQQQQQGSGGPTHFQAPPNHSQIGPASSPIVNNGHGLGGQMALPNNSAMLAAFQAASNPQAAMTASTTNNTNITAGPASSPRMARIPHSQISQPQSLSGGMIPAISAISHEIKARHLAASPEQIKRMTNEQMAAQYQHRLSQAAMNAAAGGSNAQGLAMVGDANHHLSQQRYAQIIRAQQASQSKTGPTISNGVRTPSRGATPQTQRLPNVQASPGPDHSPRVPQAQMTRGQ